MNDAGRIAHPELKYKDHIEGLIWTAMRGLDPRTGIVTLPPFSGGRDVLPAESQELANCKKAQTLCRRRQSEIACVWDDMCGIKGLGGGKQWPTYA